MVALSAFLRELPRRVGVPGRQLTRLQRERAAAAAIAATPLERLAAAAGTPGFVGALGRLLVPGPDPMGIGATIGVGVVATFLSGLIGLALFGRNGGSFIFAVLIAMAIVWLLRRTRGGGVARPRRF